MKIKRVISFKVDEMILFDLKAVMIARRKVPHKNKPSKTENSAIEEKKRVKMRPEVMCRGQNEAFAEKSEIGGEPTSGEQKTSRW